MKKTLCFALVALFFGMLAAASNNYVGGVKAEGVNLFPNGSFENEGVADQYELQWGAQVYTATGEDDENVRTGSKSILLDCSDGNWKPLARNTSLSSDIVTGREYELTMYVKATDGFRGYAFLRVYYNADQGARVDDQSVYFANNESGIEGVWEKVTYKFTLNPTYGDNVATAGFRFVFFEANVIEAGKIYIDDISLTEIPSEPVNTGVNLLSNGSFESEGVADQYELQWGAQLYTATGDDDENVRTGSKSILLDSSDGAWKPLARNVSLTSDIVTGREYELSMYLKATEGFRGYSYLHVYYDAPQSTPVDNQDVHFANNESGVEGVWEKVTYRFTLNPTYGDNVPTTGFRFSFFGGQVVAPGKVYIDDISLTKIPLEGEDLTAAHISVDATTLSIGYKLSFDFPEATALGTASDGTTTDITDDIRVTVEHNNGTDWYTVEGYDGVPLSGNTKSFAPDWHGYYRVTYTVSYAGKTDSVTVNMNVQDTLQGVKVTDAYKEIIIEKGEEYDFSGINVNKILSYSGEVPAAAGEYEIIYGNYDKDVIGEYTVTVKMTAAYYGNDVVVTDTLLVKVEEEADYSAAKITVDAATLSIGYKLSFDFPEATALGTASDGTTADITDDIRITVEHNNGTDWYTVEGYDGVPLSGSTKSFAPDWHGYYRVTYTVSYAGKTDSVTIAMNVQDTLQGVKAEVPAGKVYVHQSDDLDLSGVTVKKVLSYTNENVAGEGEYTVDYGGYEKGCELGDYVVTVRMTASYYGNEVVKEDTFTLTVIADGEEIDYSSAKITVEGTEVTIGYGIPYTFPDVIAEGKNKDGVSADIHDAVKVSLQYGTSNGVETFWNDVEGHANLAISEESRTFTADMHGYYRMKYEVTYSGVTATAYFNANIADTLISISLNTDAVTGKIHKGDALNLANLEVWAVLSYSGETRLADSLYTVDFGTLTEESDVGEYTLTVIVEQVLANVTIRKEATFTVNVVPDSEEINYSSVKIYIETTEANISYRLPYTVPDVTVKATDKDGNAVEVYSDVKITIQHGESDGTVMTWSDVAGYVDLAISEESRTFTPEMHGYYRVVYSIEYAGITDTVYFRINIMDTLQGIRIDASNVNTSIHKGEEFDTSRLSVIGTRSYTGDFSVAEGAYSVDFGGLDTSVPGEYTVTITYGEVFGGEFTTSFTVTVKDIVTSFTVTSYPTRNTFAYGEVFDMNGFAATVVFETLGEREVASSEVEISGYSARKVGKQTVTFTYDGVVGGTMEVTVSDAFYAIVINIDDVKLTYKKGEALDLSGLAVYKVMVSGSRSELNSDGYTVDTSAFENKEGVYTITVSATVDGVTKSASFEVEVQAGSGCGGDLGANAVMFAAVTLLAGVMLKKKNG